MLQSRFTEAQIIGMIKEQEARHQHRIHQTGQVETERLYRALQSYGAPQMGGLHIF